MSKPMPKSSEIEGRAPKLTSAQWRMLASVADAEVLLHFDVWGGYWWTERGKRLPAYGKSDSFPPLPLRYLLSDALVKRDERMTRLASGRQVTSYFLTDAGRAALSAKATP